MQVVSAIAHRRPRFRICQCSTFHWYRYDVELPSTRVLCLMLHDLPAHMKSNCLRQPRACVYKTRKTKMLVSNDAVTPPPCIAAFLHQCCALSTLSSFLRSPHLSSSSENEAAHFQPLRPRARLLSQCRLLRRLSPPQANAVALRLSNAASKQ